MWRPPKPSAGGGPPDIRTKDEFSAGDAYRIGVAIRRARLHRLIPRARLDQLLRVHDPTLRANPFPRLTDLFCRLPVPTLPYGPEAANLGDLMRLWVRTGV